ncbi:LysR substrate-binding domain-containing protein [Leisingera sp. D0M16]|uniref:LysR substrate-binding domain-containing protein n=1 Tax=Leisingera coralii TaxID=3351347 RepID=UPI003B79C9C2
MSGRGLPNLNALRVLAAVAREGGFSKAADTLGVTQSAVSKQIAALEAELQQPLFLRSHRKAEITAYGRHVADLAAEAFGRIETGLQQAKAPLPEQIRFWGDADFTELWLFPRLRRFEALHPDIRISISVQVGMNRPPGAEFDCAVVWGRGDWTGCRFEPLLTNTVFPVAAPQYFRALDRAPQLSDIPEPHLIHDQSRSWWRAFRDALGDRSLNPDAGRIYNRSILCLAAAARGDGVTIGDEVTTRGHIEDKTLVCPFDIRLPSPDSYFFLQPENGLRTDALLRFREWLHAEAAEHTRFFRSFWRHRK